MSTGDSHLHFEVFPTVEEYPQDPSMDLKSPGHSNLAETPFSTSLTSRGPYGWDLLPERRKANNIAMPVIP